MDELILPHQHGDYHMEAHLSEKLQRTESFQTVAELFKLLDDPSCVRIFWLLSHCEVCVINLSSLMGMTSPAVSHHLHQLKASGLITSRREGKEVYYKASASEQSRLLHRTIEETMAITCPALDEADHACELSGSEPSQYSKEQVDTVRALHEYVLQHLAQRMTIEELSKIFLMNPTTLKAIFKDVYGKSIALHIKEHRMERAAQLLRDSSDSVAQIAQSVGFSSQSKFSTAFKETYQLLPSAYRKNQKRHP